MSGDKPLTVGTFNDYFNAVERYGKTLCLPKDIAGFYTENEISLPEKVRKGCARLFKYLKGVLLPADRFLNKFPFSDFNDAFNEAKSAVGALSENIAHDVSPSEMKRWVARVAPEYGTFFLMLAYSGARLEQLHTFLRETTREERIKLSEILIPDEENGLSRPVFRLDASSFGSERKRTEYYYFPAEFREVVISYVPEFPLDRFKKDTTPAETEGTPAETEGTPEETEGKQNKKRITPKTLRKWNTNLMIRGGVPAEVAGWIEGRVPNKHNSAAAVTWKNYADLDRMAAVAYSKMEGEILSWLPVDTFKDVEPRTETPPDGMDKKKARNKKGFDELELIELLESGISQKAAAKRLGTSAQTVSKFVASNPELKARAADRKKAGLLTGGERMNTQKHMDREKEITPVKHKVNPALWDLAKRDKK